MGDREGESVGHVPPGYTMTTDKVSEMHGCGIRVSLGIY